MTHDLQEKIEVEIQDQTFSEEISSEFSQESHLVEDNLNVNKNLYYAICSPSNMRLSRKSIGKNAIWDYDLSIWFFEYKEEAELVADKYSKDGKSLLVKKMPSKIVHGLLHGSLKEKKTIK